MTVIRYEPWTLMNRLHRELNSAFGDVNAPSNAAVRALLPAVDVHAETDRYVLRADLPGVAPADIAVTADQGVLTIRGERKNETREKSAGFDRIERSAGTFVRRFTLPEDANVEAIAARQTHGVLEVTIAKQAKVEPRRIEVQAA